MSCVYCLDSGALHDFQILRRGSNLYLCAPRGQLVEGYLAIAPYRCIGSLSQMPADDFVEMARLTAAVTEFYATAYGTKQATFYEQGRAGGGAVVDELGGFPLHAHLCCLPLRVSLHAALARVYAARPLSGPHELSSIARGEPYIYVDSMDERFVYVARSPEQRTELARSRLKPAIAALAGLPGRGDWRAYPGDRELAQLVDRWKRCAAA